MYSKRESELIQQFLQQFGKMPEGDGAGDDLDDLFWDKKGLRMYGNYRFKLEFKSFNEMEFKETWVLEENLMKQKLC